MSNGENTSDPHLLDRIRKASEYYFNTLSDIFVEIYNRSKDLPIGNKQVKTRYDNAFERFELEYKLKIHLLYAFQHGDFSVKSYLNHKAEALIPDSELNGRKRALKPKPKKVPKEKKESTYEVTLRLYHDGMDYNEIASKRMLTPNTIFGHLMRFVDEGKLRFLDIVTTDHISQVRDIVDREGMPESVYQLDDFRPKGMCTQEFHRILRMLKGD
jgi:hypothetical protein